MLVEGELSRRFFPVVYIDGLYASLKTVINIDLTMRHEVMNLPLSRSELIAYHCLSNATHTWVTPVFWLVLFVVSPSCLLSTAVSPRPGRLVNYYNYYTIVLQQSHWPYNTQGPCWPAKPKPSSIAKKHGHKLLNGGTKHRIDMH